MDNGWDAVNVEISQRVKQVMAAKGLDHASAFRALMMGDKDLWRRYRAAKAREMGGQTFTLPGNLASEITALTKQKVAASEGGMDYGAGLKAVLADRPDLARRWKDAIR